MEEKGNCKGVIYQVKSGDTLYKIAKAYGIKVRDLMLANPYVNVYQLQIGDELCVPVFTPIGQGNMKPYRVGKNDTLGTILNKTKVPCDELLKINRNLFDLPVKEGTVLMIPMKNNDEEDEIVDKYIKCLEENRFDKHFLLFYNDGDTGQASSEKSEGASAQIVDMGNGFM